MEVMQFIRQEVDKKKEAAHHFKDEVIEEALVGRRSRRRRSNDAANGTKNAADYQSGSQSSDSDHGDIVDASADDAQVAKPAFEDEPKKSVYLDESAGALKEEFDVTKTSKVEAVGAKLKDVDIQKVLSAIINGKNMEIVQETFSSDTVLPPSMKAEEEDGTTSVRSIKNETQNLKIDIVDESDGEVLELEFERAVEKMHSHEYNMFCPKCSNRITKVTLRRRRERERKTPRRDLLGCLSCFTILDPIGNLLNPLNIFGTGKKPAIPPEKQPLIPPGSHGQQPKPGGFRPDEAGSSSNPNKLLPPNGGDGTVSKGDVVLDVNDGTAQGNKYHLKPHGVTNGQYPGDVQFPPEQGPVQTDPSHTAHNLPVDSRPLLAQKTENSKPFEIVKSIVYGGLVESVTSLSIVSSAAASGATTLNIVALGVANLIGGLLALFHNLKNLRYEELNEANGQAKSGYQELLGLKENFFIHSTFALLSYIVFGLVPPLVYGFTFRQTDDRDFKLVALAAASLVCIFVLAIAKAYTRGQHRFLDYSKTVTYYVTGAVMASGISYGAGHLFERFMDNMGWFPSGPVQQLLIPGNKTWASI